MSMIYKITLTPMGWFFFGGENTFDNGSSQSYMARSNHYPQQTTLLGMVRYQLLKQAGKLARPENDEDKTAVAKLVGTHSFQIDSTEKQSFGCIESISPVFIEQRAMKMLPTPLTQSFHVDFKRHANKQGGVRLYMNGQQRDVLPEAEGFDAKDYFVDADSYGHADLFIASTQVGITKADNLDDNKKGLYKQEVLRFKEPDTCYAFYLTLADGEEFMSEDYVFIGAQRSCFRMKAELLTGLVEAPMLPAIFPHPKGSILICSPTFVKDIDSLNECCLFHWSNSKHFRNFVQDDNGRLKSGQVAYRRHGAVCTFLLPGSVLFYKPECLDRLRGLLANEHMQTIGYNRFDVK